METALELVGKEGNDFIPKVPVRGTFVESEDTFAGMLGGVETSPDFPRKPFCSLNNSYCRFLGVARDVGWQWELSRKIQVKNYRIFGSCLKRGEGKFLEVLPSCLTFYQIVLRWLDNSLLHDVRRPLRLADEACVLV